MKSSPDVHDVSRWEAIIQWVDGHQSILRLVLITSALVSFLFFLPSYLRDAFWKGLWEHEVLTGMLLVFSLLSLSLIWSTGQKLDAKAFLFFNIWGARPIWLDRLMVGFTQLGNGLVPLGIALILFAAGIRRLAYELILGTLTLWLAVEVLKFLMYRSRPFIRLTQTRIVGFQAVGRSFPSGHTSLIFFMATILTKQFEFSIWAFILFYFIAVLVGITRMYVGAHYPRDVLAGAILGTAWGMLGVIVDGYLSARLT
jgi:membrane-associated phospholipid phosphatase